MKRFVLIATITLATGLTACGGVEDVDQTALGLSSNKAVLEGEGSLEGEPSGLPTSNNDVKTSDDTIDVDTQKDEPCRVRTLSCSCTCYSALDRSSATITASLTTCDPNATCADLPKTYPVSCSAPGVPQPSVIRAGGCS